MNLEKLGKSVRHELTRNPKKSVILGLMCLVAFYFWAPLLLRWLPGGSSTAESTAPTQTQVSSTTAPVTAMAATAAPDAAPAAASLNWRQVAEWIQQDDYARSATLPANLRDPFSMAGSTGQVIAGTTGEDWQEDVDVTPQQLSLVLGSTIVGGAQPIATINGKRYQLKSTVTAGSDSAEGTSEGVEFVLAEIHPNHVVLQRLGKRYLLRLSQPEPNDDLQIVRRET